MKKKIIFVNIFLFLIFYLIGDIIFSNFVYKYRVGYKCYNYSENNSFYELDKNCFAKMRLVSSIDSYEVYTNNFGERFSGKNTYSKNKKSVFFFGDSQTFGVGSDWKNTFVGILQSKLEDHNIHNFGVPSYSPTVHYYKLNEVVKNRGIKPSKIFIVLDLTDVSDESEEWRSIGEGNKPFKETKFHFEKKSFIKTFKSENLKGSRLIANYLREHSRNLRKSFYNKEKHKNEYKPVNGNPSGGYIYTDFAKLTGCDNEKKKTTFWSCGGVEVGLKKIENNLEKIGKLSKMHNSDLYIVTFPWPDTLNFGQTKFNWEQYVYKLCRISECKNVINLFPEFKEIKNKKKDWLTYLYLKNDIHLTPAGNTIVANEILKIGFNFK